MSGATDSGMVKTMGVVMACLGVLAVVCVLAARLLGLGGEDYDDPMKRNALIQRIQPMAAVRTSAEGLEGADQVAAADAPARSGEELVNGACAACHVAGVAGAPKLDDEAAWAERREAGLDALVSSVINGKGAMPARGGSDYSDEEIKLAVQHIALFDTDDSSAEAPADAEADTAVAATEPDSESAEATEATEATERRQQLQPKRRKVQLRLNQQKRPQQRKHLPTQWNQMLPAKMQHLQARAARQWLPLLLAKCRTV